MSSDPVLFKSPRDRGIYVKVKLPPGFDDTQYRRVDDLAQQVYEIANDTGPASFANFPVDNTGLVAILIAQQCCYDEEEWARVTDMGRAVLYLMYGETVRGTCITLNDRSRKMVNEKKINNV
jgi:hypothetical protein